MKNNGRMEEVLEPTTFSQISPVKESTIQRGIINYLRKTYPKAIVWKLTEESLCGIPDVLFMHEGLVIFFEVKRTGGVTSKIQRSVIKRINQNDIPAHVVTSVDGVKKILSKYLVDKE